MPTKSLFEECAKVFGKLTQLRVSDHGAGPIIAGCIPARSVVMFLHKYPTNPGKNFFAVVPPGKPGIERLLVYADPHAHGYTERAMSRAFTRKVNEILQMIEMRL